MLKKIILQAVIFLLSLRYIERKAVQIADELLFAV